MLYFNCLPDVLGLLVICDFLTVMWVGLQCVLVVFPGRILCRFKFLEDCFYLTKGMRGSRKFCQRGSKFDGFLVDKGGGIQKPLKAGHHRPASETPLNGVSLAGRCWLNFEFWLGSFVSFSGDPDQYC